jgi:hypothetical protein
MARLAYKFGVTQEKAYLTGDGNQKPLGVFTASNDGISTGRDVSTGNTTTAITFDGLIEAKVAQGRLLDQGRVAVPPRRGEDALQAEGRRRPVPVAHVGARGRAGHHPRPGRS